MASNYSTELMTLRQAFEKLESLRNEVGGAPGDTLDINVASVQIYPNKSFDDAKQNANVKKVLSLDVRVGGETTIIWRRHGNKGHVSYKIGGKGDASVDIHPASNAGQTDAVNLLICTSKFFPPVDHTESLKEAFGARVGDAVNAILNASSRTHDLLTQDLADSQRQRRQLEEEYATKVEALEKKHADRMTELDEAHRHRQTKLDEREAQLDAIDSRAARRRDFEKINERLTEYAQSFQLTKDTVQKRRPIFWTVILAAVLFLGLFLILLFATPNLLSDLAWGAHVVRALPLIGFVTAIWFFVQWNNSWLQHHANEEFRLKRLSLDVARANWLVALAMEWKEQQEEPIDPELVNHLARNLFVEGDRTEAVRTPPEEILAALLGISAELDLPGPNGGRIKIGRSGMKKMEKDIRNRAE